jgi:RNA polymerase sigma-B factor
VSTHAQRPAAIDASSTSDDATLLWRYGHTRDRATRNEIVARFMPLAAALARRRARDPRSLTALTQIAALGLIKAVERFDPARGLSFEASAVPVVTGELERFLHHRSLEIRTSRKLVERALRVELAVARLSGEHGHAPTVAQVAAELEGMDEHDVLEALHARRAATLASLESRHEREEDPLGERLDAEDGIGRAEDRVLLRTLLEVLGPAERVIVRLRFVDEMTQAQIAAVVGLSDMQVSRIVRRAIARMRDAAHAHEQALA